MAKLVGIVGSGRGKVGNFVLAKGDDGQTIARAYQPQVANPKTAKQVAQRAKVNAAGRFSRLWTKAAISPMGLTSRKNRSRFNQSLILDSKLNQLGDKASIIPELVEFSNSARQNPVVSAVVGQGSSGESVTVELNVAESHIDTIARVYLCRIPTDVSDKPAYGQFVDVMIPADETGNVHSVEIPVQGSHVGELDSEDRFHIWVVAYETLDAVSRNRYEQLYSAKMEDVEDERFIINADVVSLMSGSGAWSKTLYAGSVTTPIVPGP